MIMKTVVVLVLLLTSAASLDAQWIEGNRSQTIPTKSNGYLLVTDSTMIFWNQEHQFQTSTDNGATWKEAQQLNFIDSNTQVTKMVAIGDTIYAAMNFWWTRGLLLVSTDKGNTWNADTAGLGAIFPGGLPFIKDIAVTPGRVLVAWDNAGWTLRSFGSPFIRAQKLSSLQYISRPIVKKDTMFFYSWTDSTLYHTTDGGLTLTAAQNIGYQGVGGALVLDGNRIYSESVIPDISGEPFLQYSDDNAEHWTPIGKLPARLRQYIVIGNLIEGESGRANISRSTNFGKTWEIDTLGLNHIFADSVMNFAYTPDGSLWVVFGARNIFRQKITPVNSVPVYSEHPTIHSHISEGVLYLTMEGGQENAQIRSVRFYDILGRLEKTVEPSISTNTVLAPLSGLATGCNWAIIQTTQDESIAVKILVD